MTGKTIKGVCPICGAPQTFETRPFCSKRCADVDLHRWFSGQYAVPLVEDDEEAEEGDGAGDPPATDGGSRQ